MSTENEWSNRWNGFTPLQKIEKLHGDYRQYAINAAAEVADKALRLRQQLKCTVRPRSSDGEALYIQVTRLQKLLGEWEGLSLALLHSHPAE